MWNGPTFQEYYQQIDRNIRAEIEKDDPNYLMKVDFEEYLDYLVKKAELQRLEWDETGITVEQFNVRAGNNIEHRFRVRVPISDHPDLGRYFQFGPTHGRLNGEPTWGFDGNFLTFETPADDQAVRRGIKDVQFWLGNRNADIERGNRTLRDKIRPVWEYKRQQLEKQFGATQEALRKLNMPLYQNPNASAKPVEIKPRRLETVLEKPTTALTPQPSLKHEDVINLVNFIENYAKQFEVSPTIYANMDEEQLRDLLVGMMNANYPGSTTGETFSKLGKTDISFRVDSGNVLICECKYWSGAKAYGEALSQLFGYLTWRHNFGVLITFCRRKDMSRAVSAAQDRMREDGTFIASSFSDQSESRFITRHVHPQDVDKIVEIHHLFFDLSL